MNNLLNYGWNPFQSGPTTSQPVAGGNPAFTFGNQGTSPSTSQARTFQSPVRPKIIFLATLNLPYLSKLMNYPLKHDATRPLVPTKLPSNIPKFEGKVGEKLGDHITTFQLWCSSNSLNDDIVRLRLFQKTLTSVATKWYIELPSVVFDSFWDLANVFLNHFQLLVWYDAVIDLFSTFQQEKSTHILDHI